MEYPWNSIKIPKGVELKRDNGGLFFSDKLIFYSEQKMGKTILRNRKWRFPSVVFKIQR